MEEKRTNNEMMLRGAKLQERDIERAVAHGKAVSNGSLEVLLPKLKRVHEQSNADISERQDKVISILKGELQPEQNSPNSRRFFGAASSLKSYGKQFNGDLTTVRSPSKKGVFMTDGQSAGADDEPGFSKYGNDSSPNIKIAANGANFNTLGSRKQSHQAKLPVPKLDFLSRQSLITTSEQKPLRKRNPSQATLKIQPTTTRNAKIALTPAQKLNIYEKLGPEN